MKKKNILSLIFLLTILCGFNSCEDKPLDPIEDPEYILCNGSGWFDEYITTQGTQETERKMHKKVPVKGDNVETEINVGIEDAYFGTEKKISLRTVNRKNENFFCKNTIWN